MKFAKRHAKKALGLVLAASLANEAMAQAPAAPPATLWSFLGFPRSGLARAQFVNRRGNLPGLEKKPPLRNIADPANLAPEMPKAIQEAAKIKQAEDLAPQKIKAIKYLGKIGCGCYPGVKEGLLAALDDCTEDVRYEAVQAFMEASGNVCNTCSDTCCDADVVAKLNDMAYGMDENGCYKEPSARIRSAAAQAAQICERRLPPPLETVPNTVPNPERGRDNLPPPVAMAPQQQPQFIPRQAQPPMQPSPAPTRTASPSKHHLTSLSPTAPLAPEPARAADVMLSGKVNWVGHPGQNLRLHFAPSETPHVGEELRVYHDYLTGRQMIGRLQVIAVESDGVWARPVEGQYDKFATGDDVTTVPTKAAVEPRREVAPRQEVESPVAVPRKVAPPAVQLADARKVTAVRPPATKPAGKQPVVNRHVPPRATTRTNKTPARIFEAPPASGPVRQVAATEKPVWVADSEVGDSEE